MPWRYVLLSHNRRQLHFGDFATQIPPTPSLESLEHVIELSQVTKIEHTSLEKGQLSENSDTSSGDIAHKSNGGGAQTTSTTPNRSITLLGTPKQETSQDDPSSPTKKSKNRRSLEPDGPSSTTTAVAETIPLLTIHPPNKHVFAEWLYGLQVLTTSASSSAKQTSNERSAATEPQTQRMVEFLTRYGVKLRMLNVRFEYDGVMALSGQGSGSGVRGKESVVVPSREGLDEEYFYDVGGVGGIAAAS